MAVLITVILMNKTSMSLIRYVRKLFKAYSSVVQIVTKICDFLGRIDRFRPKYSPLPCPYSLSYWPIFPPGLPGYENEISALADPMSSKFRIYGLVNVVRSFLAPDLTGLILASGQ